MRRSCSIEFAGAQALLQQPAWERALPAARPPLLSDKGARLAALDGPQSSVEAVWKAAHASGRASRASACAGQHAEDASPAAADVRDAWERPSPTLARARPRQAGSRRPSGSAQAALQLEHRATLGRLPSNLYRRPMERQASGGGGGGGGGGRTDSHGGERALPRSRYWETSGLALRRAHRVVDLPDELAYERAQISAGRLGFTWGCRLRRTAPAYNPDSVREQITADKWRPLLL